MTDEGDVLFERRGAVGLITLNRPKALNALTHAMVVAMKARLDEWADDPGIALVAIRGAGERAFCAGGDIRAIAESGRAGTSYALDFWRDEYILNAAIRHYPKPYMALITGVAMGGGLGVSVHGKYRVIDETVKIAMPETGIGFFPDVGGSYFLSRCPGEIGLYLALTGARLDAADALYAGIATHLVSSFDGLLDQLADGRTPEDTLMVRAKDPGKPSLTIHRAQIDRIFSMDSVESVLAGLDEEGDEWSRETAVTIRSKSPTSLKIAFREVRAGKPLSFDDCMRMEFRISSRILAGKDFYEGVRSVIVDKDGAPHWRPAKLDDVAQTDIEAYFAPLGEKELML